MTVLIMMMIVGVGQTDNCNPILVSRLNRQLQRARDTTSNSAPLIIKLYFSRDTHCIGSSKSDQGRKGRKESNCLVEKRAGSLPKSPNLFQQKNPGFCSSKFLTSSSAKSILLSKNRALYFLKAFKSIFSECFCFWYWVWDICRAELNHRNVQ